MRKPRLKRVLMIAQHFPPTNFSGTARPYGFARYLAEFGYWPVVVSGRDQGGHALDYEPLKALAGRCEIHRVGMLGRRLLVWREARKQGRRRAPSPSTARAGPSALPRCGLGQLLRRKVGRQLGFFWPVVAKGCELFLRQGFDVIWATGPSWESIQAAYLLSRATGCPYIADLRDPWTYGSMWHPPDREAAEHARSWEKRVSATASRVVYTSPLTADIMRERLGPGCRDRVVTITNGFDGGRTETRGDDVNDDLIFRFVGNLGGNKNPEVLFEGIRLACQREDVASDLRVQFVGGMAGFEQRITSGTLPRCVDYVGYVTAQESRAYMAGADVLVLLQTITGPGRDVISGKAYEYLAARRPILGIVPEDGGDAWLLRETSAGIITGVTDPERIAEGIRRCWRLWKEGRLEELAPKGDISRFSRRNLTRELAGVFDEVLAEAKRRL